jgi:hypothetical protein
MLKCSLGHGSARFRRRLPELAAAQLDDEEAVGDSDHVAALAVARCDDELVGRSPVRLGDGGQPVPAARPRAFAARVGDEVDAPAIPGTARLAQRADSTGSTPAS